MTSTLLGYLVGSLPTASWIGRLAGADLHTQGSGNPGTNNARRVAGPRVALIVLIVEIAKGFAAVQLGGLFGDGRGMALAGIGAVIGNILNPWHRFRGGQGLGITGGILAAAWPAYLPVALAVIALVAVTTRSAPFASLMALGSLLAGLVFDVPTSWGLGGTDLTVLVIGLVVAISPKQLRNALRDGIRPRGLRARRSEV